MKKYLILIVVFFLFYSNGAWSQSTRFPNGVTNVEVKDALAEMIVPSPCDIIQVFEDFNLETSNPVYIYSATGTTGVFSSSVKNWVVTTTELGSTTASETVNNSTLQIINDNADNDLDYIQLQRDLFTPTSGKELFFEAKILCASGFTQSDFICGLQPTDITPLNGYGVYFQKDDGGSYFVGKSVNASGVRAVTSTVSIADDTWYKLNIHSNGTNTSFYVNDTYIGSATSSTYPTSSLVKPSFGIQNGQASSSILQVDYIFAAQER